MQSILAPICINSLFLNHPKTVMNALADFSKLPWSNKNKDFNPSTPFLAESVIHKPFQNNDLTLSPGTHLHFELPRCLRNYSTEKVDGKQKKPPAAPNRWLVSRMTPESQQHWIIESDYLSAIQTDDNAHAVTIPIDPDMDRTAFNGQPYLYLGRQVKLEEWLDEGKEVSHTYWKQLTGEPLTAFGYGELSFSTFYPNCHSVFGFYDPSPGNEEQPKRSTYQVLGWYDDPSQDIVRNTLASLSALMEKPCEQAELVIRLFNNQNGCPEWLSQAMTAHRDQWPTGAPSQPDQYLQLRDHILNAHPEWLNAILDLSENVRKSFLLFGLEQALQWKIGQDHMESMSTQCSTLFYGRIEGSELDSGQNTPPRFERLAVGNTPGEALSAYLGHVLAGAEQKDCVEGQLAALLQGGKFASGMADQFHDYMELRHESAFDSVESGKVWRVRKKTDVASKKSPSDNTGEEVSLPTSVNELLRKLNLAQENHDRSSWEQEVLEQELYSDWCKYMSTCYPPEGEGQNLPDTDLTKSYVEHRLFAVNRMKSRMAKLKERIDQAKKDLLEALPGQDKFTLDSIPGPRFYQPKDPVVLFVGDASSDRIEENPVSPQARICPGMDPSKVIDKQTAQRILQQVGSLKLPGSFASDASVWSPQILEWLTEFFPVLPKNHIASPEGKFSEDFIKDNFTLTDVPFDFEQNDHTISESRTYSGLTYVTTHAKGQMLQVLESYILRHYDQAVKKESFEADLSRVWKNKKYSAEKQDWTNPGYTAIKAWQQLQGCFVLAQSMGGFHRALLQRGQTEQLPIRDPLGFADYRTLTQAVSKALRGKRLSMPNPASYFFPIRAGGLRPTQMALTDQFGISAFMDGKGLITPALASTSGRKGWMWLNPRLSQPTRLHFRWLAARQSSAQEVNSHPDSSPVCGWLLPNYLDNSLMVYNNSGKPLGSFNANTKTWNAFPGTTEPFTEQDINASNPKQINPKLLRLMLWIKLHKEGLGRFIHKLRKSQKTICAEADGSAESLALIMGRPIAVVRSRLSLETKGGLLYDDGWIPFERELNGFGPDTDGYEHVQVPLRLGDKNQLNDGLIAYWLEKESGVLEGAANWTIEDKIKIDLALAEDPIHTTMLLDPHGCVHASCGILPVKSINIPEDQVREALSRIEVAFFTAPLLTPENKIRLSLPDEKDYHWTWLQKHGESWKRTPNLAVVKKAGFETAWQAFRSRNPMPNLPLTSPWNELVGCGWLRPMAESNDLWLVTSANDKARKKLRIWGAHSKSIEQLLHTCLEGIAPFETGAQLQQKREMLEGWLLLSPNEPSKTK